MQTERVTRSRARTLTAAGETRECGAVAVTSHGIAPRPTRSSWPSHVNSCRASPLNPRAAALVSLSGATPAATGRTARRRAAVPVATAPPASVAAAVDAEQVAPVALFEWNEDHVRFVASSHSLHPDGSFLTN